jgi:hypothetical protein
MSLILAGILFLTLTAPSEAAKIEGTARVIDGDSLEVAGQEIRPRLMVASIASAETPSRSAWFAVQVSARAPALVSESTGAAVAEAVME